MSESIGMIILAAGKGTRMKIETPKALMSACGRTLLDYVVVECEKFALEMRLDAQLSVVIGHKKEQLEDWIRHKKLAFPLYSAWQKEQKGTADALKSCFEELPHFWNHTYTLVACADTPLISKQEFVKLFTSLREDPQLLGVAATFEVNQPKGYGRIQREGKGFRIIEEKDASTKEREIKEVNSGFYILRTSHIKEVLGSIQNNNNAGEFYLTELFKHHYPVSAIKFDSSLPFLGMNNLEQLAQIQAILQERKLVQLMENGVRIIQPHNVLIDDTVQIGAGSVVYPNAVILGNSIIQEQVILESGVVIKNSHVHERAQILSHSYLEEAHIGESAVIGPFARIRPGSEIGTEVKIGNFVEVKKSKLEKGVKISHLSYVGDAHVGENSNLGCGFITCNYDGAQKHKTQIGQNTFIGSDVQVIAPIQIGNNSFIAAGSTITKDIPDGGFAISRPQQVIKEGAAKEIFKNEKVLTLEE